MENLGKISVIVPVYNAEKYLSRAVDSILGQTYPHLEVLLVNDGSKDDSLSICRKLARKDARIVVLSQPNGGAAAARNAALRKMTGSFVLFVDADDYLVPDACERMVRAICGCELVIAHYFFDVGTFSSPKGLLKGDRTLNEKEFLNELVKRPGCFYYSALWNKLYRADLIRAPGLEFDPFCDWGEDFVFNMRYDQAVHHVALVEQPIYHYVKTVGSTSWQWMLHIPHSIRVKARMYRAFRQIYLDKGLFQQYRWKIRRFPFNVTLAE